MKVACALLLAAAVMVMRPAQLSAETMGVTVEKVGSPIWKVADFQLFSAPTAGDEFLETIDKMLPLEGPGAGTYTPHPGPYETELSTNAAAAGFVNQTVFPRSAITNDPNGVYLWFMMLPDPGIVGSSRDFASGPVIPNSLFPMTSHAEMFLDGVKVETLQDQAFSPRAGDLPHDGASHRAPTQAVWYPWADDPNAGPFGHHEIRWQLRDNQGYGWNIVAGFKVVPEPGAAVLMSVAMTGLFGWARLDRWR